MRPWTASREVSVPGGRCVPVLAPDGLRVLRWVATEDRYGELTRVDGMLVAIADAARRSRGECNPQAVAVLLAEIATTAQRGLVDLRDARAELDELVRIPPFEG